MKIINWLFENILLVITLFLLIFIPLYPKIPLFDIRNTWVYIRLDDVVVVSSVLVWSLLIIRKKVSLKTPLTMPILIFWIIGAIATIHGVLLIFPTLANVFPNVAFLSYLRRIEYLSLFFVAFSGIKDKKHLLYVGVVLTIALFAVVGYGAGQRYLGFPAFLTMNEEFAKGEPIRLSQFSRVPSTFAGHYDLAAYLVLVLPILTSLVFGVRKWIPKLIIMAGVVLGFVLMFMTVSRVSFFVLFIAIGAVLIFQKKKIVLFVLPVIALLSVLFLSLAPALIDRFGSTIKQVDVLVDATTGEAIGSAKLVPSDYFKDKIIIQDYVLKDDKVDGSSIFEESDELFNKSTDTLSAITAGISSPSAAVVPYYLLSDHVTLLVPANVSTGENLPQGTGYINLSLSPVTRKIGEYFYEKQDDSGSGKSADVVIINGNFLVKKASAYDLSFTTRFQGEWPHAIKAFMRNIFFGSGYGSISLAIDNNYFRILGEVGLLGIVSFLIIFITGGIYIKKTLPYIQSPLIRSFIIGFVAGVFGLALNAVLIDVFEASKVAYVLWLLMGVVIGVLHLHQKEKFDILKELKKSAFSTPAIVIYLLITSIFVFSPMLSNYFVGDDFTWFRWAAENNNFLSFFTKADGFFYRPGTKLYFSTMYKMFWLNQTVYHTVSMLMHFIVTVLVFLLSKKILKDNRIAALSGFLFLFLSGYHEAVFWISSTGYLFTAFFMILSLLFFVRWIDYKKIVYFFMSLLFLVLSLLFHELGVVTILLLLFYYYIYEAKLNPTKLLDKKIYMFILFVPMFIYGLLRFIADSHWFSGDYNYNLIKLPVNSIGNVIGYLFLSTLGPFSLPFYSIIRNLFKEQFFIALILGAIFLTVLIFVYRFFRNMTSKEDSRIILFSTGLFIIGLIPFLGLGNITSRYSYVSSIGFVIIASFSIKKIYSYLLDQGKEIALAVAAVFITLFMLFHLMQIQQIHSDWNTAGKKAERFLIAINEAYNDYWAVTPMKFYFVNTPIKSGDAWIFPVGLKDALWFSFGNSDITINNSPSVEDALKQIYGTREEKVFEFIDSGKIIEHRKPSYNR